eukprot:Lankesteria_metandrocarpae@DN3937_c0_g1_i2.p2
MEENSTGKISEEVSPTTLQGTAPPTPAKAVDSRNMERSTGVMTPQKTPQLPTFGRGTQQYTLTDEEHQLLQHEHAILNEKFMSIEEDEESPYKNTHHHVYHGNRMPVKCIID